MNPFGTIKAPEQVANYATSPGMAVSRFLNVGLKTLIVVASIYSLFNLVLAGYAFMSAGDDSKRVAGAWAKIWQTMLGLAVSAGAFVLAAIFGQLIFGDATFILKPTIPTL